MKDPIKISLQFLKFRPRSVFEVRKKLSEKGISTEEIEKTIRVLKNNQLLDDEKFAKMWIEDRNLLKPTGKFLLKLELKKLGIENQIIEQNLKNQNEEDLAKRALDSKHRLKNAEFNQKASFLSRRGFSPNIIYGILKKDS